MIVDRRSFRDLLTCVIVYCDWCCSAAPHNVIPDGFYDVGQLKDSDQLRSVEEYGKEEVNERRPVIIINPKPELVNVHGVHKKWEMRNFNNCKHIFIIFDTNHLETLFY